MPRQKPTTQLATLEKHQAALEAKLREAKTKVKAEAKQNERLKCELVGAVALKEFAANPSTAFASALRGLLNTGITKAAVRAELGLAPLPKQARKHGGAAAPVATTEAKTTPAPQAGQAVPLAVLAKAEVASASAARPPAPAPKANPPPSPSSPIASALRGLGFGGSASKGTK